MCTLVSPQPVLATRISIVSGACKMRRLNQALVPSNIPAPFKAIWDAAGTCPRFCALTHSLNRKVKIPNMSALRTHFDSIGAS